MVTLTHPSAPSKGTALARSLTAAFAHDGKLYFGYGNTFVSTAPIPIHRLNPATNTWELVTTAMTERVGAFAVVGSELWATHDDPSSSSNFGYSRLAGGTVANLRLLGTVTNLLTANAASFETDASPLVGGDANMVVTSDTTQFADGAKSVKITRANTTGFVHASLAAADRVACVPGKLYTALATVKAPVASSSLRVDMQWYDSVGALISSSPGPALATNSTTFVQIYGNGVAPANAATVGFRVGYAVAQVSAASSFYVDKCSVHLRAFVQWTPGGTSALADWVPVHIYGVATRVAGEHYLCGPIGATGSPCLMRTTDNGATWVVAVEGAVSSTARYYNVAALNGVVYTVLGDTLNGSTPQESYVYDVGNPCVTWDGATQGVGPILDGFIKPLNFAGALVYRAVDGRLLSFDGTTVTQRRWGGCVDHYVAGGLMYVVRGRRLWSSPDLITWRDLGVAPANTASLAVLDDGRFFFGTSDSTVIVGDTTALDTGYLGTTLGDERRDVEIRVPFAIGPSGGVSTTADPAIQAAQHLISVIGTSLTERVMRPSYGTSAQGALFDADDPSDQAVLASEIRDAARTWAPDLEVLRVDSRSIGTNDGRLEFAVQFRLEEQVEEVVVRSG